MLTRPWACGTANQPGRWEQDLSWAAPVACKPASETKQPIKEKLLPIFSTRPHFNFAPMRASANHTMAWLLITALLLNPEVAGEGVKVSVDTPLVLES